MNPATTAPATTGNTLPAVRHVRLNALGPVGLNNSACLHLHKTWVACSRCRDACPKSCLTLEAGTIRLDAGPCIGCGLCAIACPTEALAVDGFSLDEIAAPPSGKTIRIGCRNQIADEADVISVPCLAGLPLRSLLTMLWLYPEQEIELLDSTGCPTCQSEPGQPSAAQKLTASVGEVLFDCGLSLERIKTTNHQAPLPNGNGNQASRTRPAAGRRSFFSGLGRAVSQGVVRKASGASPLVDPAHLPKQPRHAVPFTGGHETRLLMLHLAAHTGAVPLQARLPQIVVNGQCCGHAACSRLCPTGALRSSHHGHALALSFDAWRCIDCGACRAACPEKALHYDAPQIRDFEQNPALFSRVDLADCTRCNESYSPADHSGLCPTCRKSAALSQAGLALFASIRNHVPVETGPP